MEGTLTGELSLLAVPEVGTVSGVPAGALGPAGGGRGPPGRVVDALLRRGPRVRCTLRGSAFSRCRLLL